MNAWNEELERRLRKIEEALDDFLRKLEDRLIGRPTQPFYTVEEFAELVKRAADTVRVWCWRGRIIAEKAETQAGPHQRWVISRSEYERYLREGLLKPQGV